MIAPALRQFATGGLSADAIRSLNAATPFVVALPAQSTLILMVTGTPCSGPSGSWRIVAASARSASARASSCRTSTTALICGLTSRKRVRQLSTASRLLIWPARIALASSQALHRHNAAVFVRSREPCSRVCGCSSQGPNGFSRSSRALASFATLKSNSCSRVTFFSTKLKYLLLQKSCMAMMESTGGIPSSLR